jgi:L-glyceraldehyde 3-phosphate reductase
MKYRRLGKSGLQVSEIALGSWLTYGTVTEKQTAIQCVHTAFEQGINHFDCANVYGAQPHAAEEFLAEALKPFDRGDYVLTTKAFWPVGNGPNDRGLSRKHIMREVERSLKALNTDYVDIFYCHRFDPNTDLEETLRAIDDLITQGKILYAGISEWTAAQMAQAIEMTKQLGLHKIVASQPIYNLFERYIEPEILPLCEREGIGQVVFSPLAQGLLTGKYRLNQPIPSDSRAAKERVNRFIREDLTEEKLAKVEKLIAIADKLGIKLSQLALAWVLRQPGVSSALIGASRPEQIIENVKAVDITLDADVLAEIEAVLS